MAGKPKEEWYKAPLQHCDWCGDTFRKHEYRFNKSGKNKYCNIICCNKHHAYKRQKSLEEVSRTCQYCGKVETFIAKPWRAKMYRESKFCSPSCANKSRYDKEWQDGNN